MAGQMVRNDTVTKVVRTAGVEPARGLPLRILSSRMSDPTAEEGDPQSLA
jgi:hypothetical protein